MTAEALKAKLEKEAPPVDWQTIDIFTDEDVKAQVEEARVITERMKADEARLKELKPDIEAYLMAGGVEKVDVGGGVVLKIGRGTSPSSLSATKLVEKGVSIDTIAECTKEGSPYTFVQFVFPKTPATKKGRG